MEADATSGQGGSAAPRRPPRRPGTRAPTVRAGARAVFLRGLRRFRLALTPPPGIECPPHLMTSFPARTILATMAALLAVLLSGCAVKHPVADEVHGKMLFVQKCGSCHTLSHAGTT